MTVKHGPIPTVRVTADTLSGYRIINAADHDPEIHLPWPPEPKAAPAEPAPAVAEAIPAPFAPRLSRGARRTGGRKDMLVVKDGSCDPDAESCAWVADADAYHAAWANAGWTGTNAATGATLQESGSYLDGIYRARYVGRKRSPEQALAWPRINAVGTNGWLLPIDAVPPPMARAACEAALRAMGGDVQPDIMNSGVITYYRDKIGPLEGETHYQGGSMRTRYTAVEDALSGIVRGRESVGLVRS